MIIGFYLIGEDLAESWVEDFAAQGLSELEVSLAKHAAFDKFYRWWVSQR